MMPRFSRVTATLLAVCLAAQVALLIKYQKDRRDLKVILDRVASPELSPSVQATTLLNVFRNQSDRENNSYFLLPLFSFLRATPLEVAVDGGDCGDRCRLVVVMLGMRGIRASKWALHSANGAPKHAVVEAQVETGPMVLDPLFHLWFPRPDGGYYGIEDLKHDPDIIRRRLSELLPLGTTPFGDPLPGYSPEEYNYSHPRTINWNKSFAFSAAYRVLHAFLGAKADTIPRPIVVEQPALILVGFVGVLELAILGAWVALRIPRRNSAAATMSRRRGGAIPTHTR